MVQSFIAAHHVQHERLRDPLIFLMHALSNSIYSPARHQWAFPMIHCHTKMSIAFLLTYCCYLVETSIRQKLDAVDCGQGGVHKFQFNFGQ